MERGDIWGDGGREGDVGKLRGEGGRGIWGEADREVGEGAGSVGGGTSGMKTEDALCFLVAESTSCETVLKRRRRGGERKRREAKENIGGESEGECT